LPLERAVAGLLGDADLGARRVDPRSNDEFLKDIQAQDNVACLLVARNLATVRHMADHTVVIYLGKVVEYAPKAAVRGCAPPHTPRRFSPPF
jgi:ABC-type antimicrobial peptide transport system ATPase subunit